MKVEILITIHHAAFCVERHTWHAGLAVSPDWILHAMPKWDAWKLQQVHSFFAELGVLEFFKHKWFTTSKSVINVSKPVSSLVKIACLTLSYFSSRNMFSISVVCLQGFKDLRVWVRFAVLGISQKQKFSVFILRLWLVFDQFRLRRAEKVSCARFFERVNLLQLRKFGHFEVWNGKHCVMCVTLSLHHNFCSLNLNQVDS